MITLSNGDKWIIDDSEWQDAKIPDEEAIKGNIPETSLQEFIEAVANGSCLPCKLTYDEFPEGHWDCNYDVFEEAFADIAVAQILNPWSKAYRMPWGHIYVVFSAVDSGGYDARTVVEKFESAEKYRKAACSWTNWKEIGGM